MENDKMYFIAVIPPEEICSEITAFKTDFATRFNSKAALRIIPHITLKAPFKTSDPVSFDVKVWFENLRFPFEPFAIDLNNFGTFNHKKHPVVFVQPAPNRSLDLLQQYVIHSFRQAFPGVKVGELEQQFHPHITIAYRDLTFLNFSEAMKFYNSINYITSFIAGCVYLLQNIAGVWVIVASKTLTNKS